jgi:FkbH-like protein
MIQNLDYNQLLKESRTLSSTAGTPILRIAFLGDVAVQQFTPLLRALFGRVNFQIEVYEGGFDGSEFETLNPASALFVFKPDVIIIMNAVQSLRDKFYERSCDASQFAFETISRITRIWNSIRENSVATIIQTNYAAPVERTYGHYDLKVATSLPRVVTRINSAIIDEAENRSHVLLLDVEHLASWTGRSQWFDERFWTISKSFCAIDLLPLVANNIVDIILSTKGRAIKCVVLDLDNTLWGGIVGDDGTHGIQIGAHGDGEDFYRFQCFLRELKNRGIMLAVCSKNEQATALAPFEENPEMVLKQTDFAVFVANWNNKAENIRLIRQVLNIGFDTMVFLDDNPFERNLVRELLPEVLVPELSEDPSEYVRSVCALNLFETSSHSAEDGQRTEFYRVEAQREIAKGQATSFEDFLQALAMRIGVKRFEVESLARIVQLFQRSNQFNLTTRRHSYAQCEEMMADSHGCLPLSAALSDKFGDHGLVSIVVLRPDPQAGVLIICDWLMSCRVLMRGVEDYLMNKVVAEAESRGLPQITGQYIPTAKNGMVRDFFARFGFEKVNEDSEGKADWLLNTRDFVKREVFIQPLELS